MLTAPNKIIYIFWGLIFFLLPSPSFALSPNDIIVVYNSSVKESIDVAYHYYAKRNIPLENLLGIAMPFSEDIKRKEYDLKFLPPVTQMINKLKTAGQKPVLLFVYGIPLRINEDTVSERKDYKESVKKKEDETKKILLDLSIELESLIEPDISKAAFKDTDTSDNTAIFKGVQKLILKFSNQARDGKIENPAVQAKAAAIVFILSGFSPFASDKLNQIQKKTQGEAADILKSLDNDSLLRWANLLNENLLDIEFKGVLPKNADKYAAIIRAVNGVLGEWSFWHRETSPDLSLASSLDSEAALLLYNDYNHYGWLSNPYWTFYDKINGISGFRDHVLMTARLDAPTPELAMRLIDDAVLVEHTGLDGTFYIDARGRSKNEKVDSYTCYDRHLTNLYSVIKKDGGMPVILEDTDALFSQKGEEAALYAGWYSLAKYIDAFNWKKGAVGFHIASSELTTLRKKGSQVWGKRMIEEGVAVTIGPVSEPYLTSFPLPDLFFPLLMQGKDTLIEVYFKTTPYLSWQQVLIGDPLYNPFKKKPHDLVPPDNILSLCN